MATTEWTPLLSSRAEAKTDDPVIITILNNTVIAFKNRQVISHTVSDTRSNDFLGHTDTLAKHPRDSSDGPPNSDVTGSKMGDLKTIMTVITGGMGCGILAMPYGMYCAGLLEEGDDVDMNYANAMAWSLRTAHPSLRDWPAVWGGRFVNVLLITAQLGKCCIYIVFVAANIRQAVYAGTSWDMAIWKYQLAVACPLLLYSQLRGLKRMAPCSFLANCLVMVGLIIIFVNLLRKPLPNITMRPAFAGWTVMPAFFGMTMNCFGFINLVLPVEMQVKNKETFSAPCGVLTLSLMVIIVLFTTMGFFGYLVYGDYTQASITLNLPATPWYYFAVKPTYAIAVFLSYSLQLFVPVNVVKNWLVARYGWNGAEFKNKRHLAEAGVRVSFFLITLVISIVVPDLHLLMSLVGAVANTFLALILPAFIYLLTVVTQPQRPRVATVIFLVFIMTVGFLGFVIGTYTSVNDIVYSL